MLNYPKMNPLPDLVLAQKDKLVYNAVDMWRRIWSVWKIDNGQAYCQASNVTGRAMALGSYEVTMPVEYLKPYTPPHNEFVSDGNGNLFPLEADGQLRFCSI